MNERDHIKTAIVDYVRSHPGCSRTEVETKLIDYGKWTIGKCIKELLLENSIEDHYVKTRRNKGKKNGRMYLRVVE